VLATLLTPVDYLGEVLTELRERRGEEWFEGHSYQQLAQEHSSDLDQLESLDDDVLERDDGEEDQSEEEEVDERGSEGGDEEIESERDPDDGKFEDKKGDVVHEEKGRAKANTGNPSMGGSRRGDDPQGSVSGSVSGSVGQTAVEPLVDSRGPRYLDDGRVVLKCSSPSHRSLLLLNYLFFIIFLSRLTLVFLSLLYSSIFVSFYLSIFCLSPLTSSLLFTPPQLYSPPRKLYLFCSACLLT